MKKKYLFLSLMLIFLISFIVAIWNSSLSDKLFILYEMNDTSDTMGNHNLGYSGNPPTFQTAGCNLGSCLFVSGAGSTTKIPHEALTDLNVSRNFTFGFWFNTSTTGVIFMEMTNGAKDIEFSTNRITLYGIAGAGTHVYSPMSIYQWNLILWTFNDSDMCAYINGTLDECHTSWIGFPALDLTIDPYADNSALLGDTYVWNKTLTAIDIQNLWNNGNGIYYDANPDTTFPNITINTPSNNSYTIKTIVFNVTALDETGMFDCLYSLNDGANNYSMANTTTTLIDWVGTNSTMAQGSHTATFYCNDSTGNLNNTESINFYIDSIFPVINITHPQNSSYSSTIIELNYTYTETNRGYCWYSNNSGIINSSVVVGGTNFTYYFTEGEKNITIYCNDTINNINKTSVSFFVDSIAPNVSINSITTTAGSQTISWNSTEQDVYNASCWYEVRNSTDGIDGIGDNSSRSYVCGAGKEHSMTTTNYGNFNLTIYANDTSNNLNSSTQSFTTIAGGSSSSSGGGGGGSRTDKVKVIAIIKPNESEILTSNLQRAIIFRNLFQECQTIATKCSLTNNKKINLIAILKNQTIEMDLDELKLWIDNYNLRLFDNVEVSLRDETLFNLYSGIVVPESEFKIDPVTLTPICFITSTNSTCTFSIKSDEVLVNTSIVFGEVGLNIEQTGTTTAIINYKPPILDFSAKVVEGEFSYTSKEGKIAYQRANIRVINIRSPTILFSMVILVGFILFAVFKRGYISTQYKKAVKKFK